jgi:hypothetical protein
MAPLPDACPSYVKALHAELVKLPHLDPSTLVVSEPIPATPGPPMPQREGQGRRRRGKTYAGEGVDEFTGGLWSWVVMAQVRILSRRL